MMNKGIYANMVLWNTFQRPYLSARTGRKIQPIAAPKKE